MKILKNKIFKKFLFCTIVVFSLCLTTVSFANANFYTNLENLLLQDDDSSNKKFEIAVENDATYLFEVVGKKAFICDVVSNSDVISVPKKLNGKIVTELAAKKSDNGTYESVFSNAKNLKVIMLPDTIKILGYRAFYGCKKLKQIILPTDFHFVFEEAFKNCENLKYLCVKHKSEIFKIKNQQDVWQALLANITKVNKAVLFKNNLI